MSAIEGTHARCHVPPAAWEQEEIVLAGDESNHLARVLRVKPGERVELFDGCGGEGTAEVLALEKKRVRLRRLSRSRRPPPAPAITLVQAVIREAKMDWVVQKAVELGVSALVPVLTARGVVRLDAAKAERRAQRWAVIALNAARQCRAAWLPRLEVPRPLEDVLAGRPTFDLFMMGTLGEEARPLREVLRAGPGRPRTVGVLVGPEGDFTDEERRAAREAGAVSVTLGSRVLRAETAALYLLSVLQYEYGG